MRRVLTAAFAALLTLALLGSAAQGATKIRRYRADTSAGGAVTLKVVFKNERSERTLFTPRLVTGVGLESVPLVCANRPAGPISQLQLTRSVQAAITVQPAGPPDPTPKKGRYRFVFAGVTDLPSMTISGKIDKPDKRKRGTLPRARGKFTIADLDLATGFTDCATIGSPEWSAPRPENN